MFQIIAIRVSTSILLTSVFFQDSPKSRQIFGLLLQENLLPGTFKNRPIWCKCRHLKPFGNSPDPRAGNTPRMNGP